MREQIHVYVQLKHVGLHGAVGGGAWPSGGVGDQEGDRGAVLDGGGQHVGGVPGVGAGIVVGGKQAVGGIR